MQPYIVKDESGKTVNTILASEDFMEANYKGLFSLRTSGTFSDEHNLLLKKEEARIWRNAELFATDIIAQTPDFPNRDKTLTYRQALRDWPSTSDFPNLKPSL